MRQIGKTGRNLSPFAAKLVIYNEARRWIETFRHLKIVWSLLDE